MRMVAPEWSAPATLTDWLAQRTRLREQLLALLAFPARPALPRVLDVQREVRAGYALERLTLDNGAGATMPGYCLIPAGEGPFPAILYLHAHGSRYNRGKDELFAERVPGIPEPGVALVRQGYVVLCMDAYAFGERQSQGPAGADETGFATEYSLSKLFLWQGTSLWAMMVRDDLIALDYLSQRPEVDASRIAATGMSMGSTRAWWLAALDERIRAVVGVACLTRYTELIAHGALDKHSIYYFVPGMLRHFDTEVVTSLIAPRPFLTLLGDRDPGSPVEGAARIAEVTAQVYALYGRPEVFQHVVYPDVAHEYTPAMWEAMLSWMGAVL